MSRVITFSRTFPSYHPRRGHPTYFIEKIHFGIIPLIKSKWSFASDMIRDLNKHIDETIVQDFIDGLDDDTDFSGMIKHHTIRAGHRWKVGDWFSPRVWGNDVNPKSGKSGPYHSKQIIIGPDIQIKKTWDFHVDINGVCSMAKPGEQLKYLDEGVESVIAKNDGLTEPDFINWIVMPFYKKEKDSGPMQIIGWNENINY